MKLRLLACLVVLIASTLAVAGPVEIAVNGTQGGTTYLAGPKGVAQSARVRLPQLAAGQDVTILTDGVTLQGGLGIVVRGDFKDPTKPIVIKLKTDASVEWSGTHTFAGPLVAKGTMQVPSSATLPTTCSASPAEVYVDTDAPSGQRLFICESNNTWVPILTTEFRSGTGIKLYESDNSNWVGITTPALAANWTLVLPQDDGDPGDVLCVPNGDGVSDWCTPGGGGDITQVWTGTNGDVSALVAASGDTFDAGSADSSKPATRSTSLPPTCAEGQLHQDTDSGGSETYVCTATNTWTKLQSSFAGGTNTQILRGVTGSDPIWQNKNVVDVRDYGAVCDGVTNDATALQNAFDALPSRGGVIEFPPAATCLSTSALNLDTKQGVILRGGGGRQNTSASSILSFNLTGAGSLLSAQKVAGLTIKDLTVRTQHASFTGKLVDASGVNGVSDSNFVDLDNAYLIDIGGGVRSTTLLYLDRVVSASVRNSRLQNGGTAIYGKASSGSYSSSVTVKDSLFRQQDVAAIKNPGNGWVITGNNFGALAGGTSVAITHDAGVYGNGQLIEGNIFFGSTTGSSPWITTASTGSTISSNAFIGHSGGTEVGVKVDENTFTGVISENDFSLLGTGVSCYQPVVAAVQNLVGQLVGRNRFTTVTTPMGPGCGSSSITNAVNVMDFGAKCDGSDDSVALQAAINAACPTNKAGGTIYVPAKTCSFSSTLNLCSSLAIVGSETTERSGYSLTQPHELSYSGTGTALNATSLSGLRISGVLIRAGSASFTSGTLLDITGSSYIQLDRVFFLATVGQSDTATSKAIVAKNVVGLWITGSTFSRFGYHIYGRSIAGDYTNVVNIKDTVFYRSEQCSIQNMGDTWNLAGNWWQQQGASDTKSYMICHDAGLCQHGVQFSGNMSVDQPTGPTNAEFSFCGSGVSITGNFIGGGGQTQDGIEFSEACDGCTIDGNWFTGVDEPLVKSGTGASASKDLVLANGYTNVATPPYLGVRRVGASGLFINDPVSIWLNIDTDSDSGSGAVVIGSNARDNSATQQYVFLEGPTGSPPSLNGYVQYRRGNAQRFFDRDDSNYVEIALGATNLTANWTWILPPDDGSPGYLMRTDGSGVSTWTPVVQAATGYAVIDSTTGSAGNRVLELKNSNVTNTPTEATYIARTTTTDGTQTSVTFEQPGVASGEVARFKADVVARCTGGASCGTAVGGTYTVTWACINIGGTTTILGAADIDVEQESASIAATWAVTGDCDDTSDTGRLRVTGAATSNITWVSVIKKVTVTS